MRAFKEETVAWLHIGEATPKVWRAVKQSLAGARNPSKKNLEVFLHLAELCGAVDELRARRSHRKDVFREVLKLEAQRQRLEDEAEKAEKAQEAAKEEEARVRSGAVVAKRRKRYHLPPRGGDACGSLGERSLRLSCVEWAVASCAQGLWVSW